MEVQILDRKNFSDGSDWLLCKVSLFDFVSSADKDSFDYETQRGIVENAYLDRILNSIVLGEPLLPITLTTKVRNDSKESEYMMFDTFYILDGFQRTYRLWLYWKFSTIVSRFTNRYECEKAIMKLYEEKALLKIIPINQLMKLCNISPEKINVYNLDKYYKSFSVYLYVWNNITEERTINEMLKLNIG